MRLFKSTIRAFFKKIKCNTSKNIMPFLWGNLLLYKQCKLIILLLHDYDNIDDYCMFSCGCYNKVPQIWWLNKH